MFEGMTCLYKSNVDLYFYVVGSGSSSVAKEINQCCGAGAAIFKAVLKPVTEKFFWSVGSGCILK